MKRVIKRAVSFVLVFMTVFSVFTILPSEVFHTAYVKAAEMFSSETGASAQETYTTDDFTYTLIDEYSKVQILSYIGSDTDVVIPDRIDNKKVTSIADSAFREKSITSVVFGQYVESISNQAFYSCQSLNKLDFSKSSVKTIGNYAFASNKVLESVEFPDSLESIGDNAFKIYEGVENKLKSVKFGKGLKTIGNGAFYHNRKLTNIEFTGENLTSIGSKAFQYCDFLTELNLKGNGETVINYDAFYSNDALKKISLAGIKTIGDGAFEYCGDLNSVNFVEGLLSIGSDAFRYCPNIETVSLPESLTTINDGAFKRCSKLTSIDIPNKVTKLNDNTFAYCTSLKNVSIGSGCTSISATAFVNTSSIDRITVSEDNKNFTVVDGVLYNKDMTTLVLYPKNCSGEFAVPDTVTTIADYAFDNSPNITKVTIGKNVKTIGFYAFSVNKACKYLSGGNQQKVVLAKWLSFDPDILIFDEPTRGIDVAAKMEIYGLMDKLAVQGKAIIMISSELPEVIGMSDRIYIMHEGKIVDEVKRGTEEFNSEAIGARMMLGAGGADDGES